LWEAFAGESQARNKYTFFASVAKKEGYEQIAALFLETAEQEKEHAKLHFKALSGIGDTAANLKRPPRARAKSGPACIPECERGA
jgi:rubrerythrin